MTLGVQPQVTEIVLSIIGFEEIDDLMADILRLIEIRTDVHPVHENMFGLKVCHRFLSPILRNNHEGFCLEKQPQV
jgi:hypothetical protein